MPKFNINKIRSAGLRYIVADADTVDADGQVWPGQVWAFEAMPVREDNHWRLANQHLIPKRYGEEYRLHWNRVMYWKLKGREFCMPLFNSLLDISWDDEPYDIVEHSLVNAGDLKIWPEF